MLRKIPPLVWLALPAGCLIYLYNLSAAGLLGPDEPRYASVAREMARSGDWITPRLWGEPWFEKPALLYWMSATGFRAGLGSELAPRLPVALLALLFLAVYWWILKREFGSRVAGFSVLILGTCAGYVGFSQVGVTDLPLTVATSAAMLLALPWIAKGDQRFLPVASGLLGLAVLAKGLVGLVLAVPILLRARYFRDLIRWRVVLPFLLVALPWYVLCYLRNGRVFLDVFFWQHHFERFTSTALQHPQPWWFYFPVVLGGLLPWTPLLFRVGWTGGWRDPRRLFLLAWVAFGFVFFSVAANKLPGYVLPLLPPAAVLMALALDEAPDPRPWLAACGLLLVLYLAAAPMLAAAISSGLGRAPRPGFSWAWLLPLMAAGAMCWTGFRTRRLAAAGLLAFCAGAGVLYLKAAAMPEINRQASARQLWREIESRSGEICVDSIQRDWRYGLNYYSAVPLSNCAQEPKPLVLQQAAGETPRLVPANRSASSAQPH